LILMVWLLGLLTASDLTVPLGTVRGFRNVLAVFPHADDETVNCGGTMRRLSANGAKVTLVLLTAGERGNPAAVADDSLKGVRGYEAERAVKLLGLSQLVHQDFGDGRVAERRVEVTSYLAETIRIIQPDLIVTYDRAGSMGTPTMSCARRSSVISRLST
jgi:LmbE family N-acetylglucosaminyl deacetylase